MTTAVPVLGAKHRDEIYQAFEQIYPVLQEFRKGMTEIAPEATEGAEESAKGKANAELEGTPPLPCPLFPNGAYPPALRIILLPNTYPNPYESL
jgi:hypothetical protein